MRNWFQFGAPSINKNGVNVFSFVILIILLMVIINVQQRMFSLYINITHKVTTIKIKRHFHIVGTA